MKIILDIDDNLSDAMSITFIGVNAHGEVSVKTFATPIYGRKDETLIIRKDKECVWLTQKAREDG